MTMQVELRMTATELSALSTHEEVIERGLRTFREVGAALLAIRDGRLYREQYGTFEEYCQERWGFQRHYANRMIAAAEVVGNLVPTGTIPTSERQARPLTRLEPEAQRQAWEEAVDTAPNGKVTGAHVAKVVERYMPEPEVQFVPGEPKPYPNGDVLPNGHATEYNPVRLDVTPVTQRPLSVTESEAVIARYIERHGEPEDLSYQRAMVESLIIKDVQPLLRDDRIITYDTFKSAKRLIADELGRKIHVAKQAEPKERVDYSQRTIRLSYMQLRALYAFLLIKGLGPNEGDERVGRAMNPSVDDFEAAFEVIRRAALYAPEPGS